MGLCNGFREAPLKSAYRNVAVSARLVGRPEDTDHGRRKAIHVLSSPTPPRYLKIPLLRNGGAGGQNAARMYETKQSQTRPRCLAVSLVREKPWRQASVPQEDRRHSRA